MPIRRKYQTYEVRRMLQQAEHRPSPITKVGAHSRSLHSMRTPGGVGVNKTEMMHRTHKSVGESNKAFKKRGGTTRTSTFKNLVQQADAAQQALNSTKGQAALALLDSHMHKGKNLRVTLEVGPIHEAGFLPATPSPGMHTVHKSHVMVNTPGAGASGVRLILDRVAHHTDIHIQTCFPLDTLTGSKYSIKDMDKKINIANG